MLLCGVSERAELLSQKPHRFRPLGFQTLPRGLRFQVNALRFSGQRGRDGETFFFGFCFPLRALCFQPAGDGIETRCQEGLPCGLGAVELPVDLLESFFPALGCGLGRALPGAVQTGHRILVGREQPLLFFLQPSGVGRFRREAPVKGFAPIPGELPGRFCDGTPDDEKESQAKEKRAREGSDGDSDRLVSRSGIAQIKPKGSMDEQEESCQQGEWQDAEEAGSGRFL